MHDLYRKQVRHNQSLAETNQTVHTISSADELGKQSFAKSVSSNKNNNEPKEEESSAKFPEHIFLNTNSNF